MREEGVPVGNVWIRGGEVQIESAPVETKPDIPEGEPEPWD